MLRDTPPRRVSISGAITACIQKGSLTQAGQAVSHNLFFPASLHQLVPGCEACLQAFQPQRSAHLLCKFSSPKGLHIISASIPA